MDVFVLFSVQGDLHILLQHLHSKTLMGFSADLTTEFIQVRFWSEAEILMPDYLPLSLVLTWD